MNQVGKLVMQSGTFQISESKKNTGFNPAIPLQAKIKNMEKERS